jgi:hypothetical protein
MGADAGPLVSKQTRLALDEDDLRRIQCLIYDFRCFSKNSAAENRILQANIHPFGFGPPYMTLENADALLEMKGLDDLTLRQYLTEIIDRKGYHICTSHTLAPALATFFGIETDFKNDSGFTKYYSRFSAAALVSGADVADLGGPMEISQAMKKGKERNKGPSKTKKNK